VMILRHPDHDPGCFLQSGKDGSCDCSLMPSKHELGRCLRAQGFLCPCECENPPAAKVDQAEGEVTLDPESIRAAICVMVDKSRDLNERGAAHYEGVIRGLVWCLTGEDPGRYYFDTSQSLKEMFDAAGISARVEGEVIRFDLEDKYLTEDMRV